MDSDYEEENDTDEDIFIIDNDTDDDDDEDGKYQDDEFNVGNEDEDGKYQDEFNVGDRVGGLLDADTDIMNELGLANKDTQDPVFRFAAFVRKVAIDMTNQGYIHLNLSQEVPLILRRIIDLPIPQYKNPTGYVLGYWVVSDCNTFNSISKKRFHKLEPGLEKIDYPLKKQDIIRYARLWISNNLLFS